MARWVQCNNSNGSAFVNLDVASFADVITVSGTSYITVHGPDNQSYTLTNSYATGAAAIAALADLLQGEYTQP